MVHWVLVYINPTNEIRKSKSTQSFCRDLKLNHDSGEQYLDLQEKVGAKAGAEGDVAHREAEVHHGNQSYASVISMVWQDNRMVSHSFVIIPPIFCYVLTSSMFRIVWPATISG